MRRELLNHPLNFPGQPCACRRGLGRGACGMPDTLKFVARRLRNDQTSAERKLWTALRRHGVDGFRFRRQVAFSGFIVDFASYEARLIVEVDGATHSTESEVARDARRDEILRANGNSVLRFTNDEVFHNLEGVVETIRLKLIELRPREVGDVPSPLVGEGEGGGSHGPFGFRGLTGRRQARRDLPPQPSPTRGEGGLCGVRMAPLGIEAEAWK